jgi:hypothetical protein
MKKTPLVIVVTAVFTCAVVSFVETLRGGVERLWLVSAVKVPGSMAIVDIQKDLKDGHYVLAKAKLQAFKETWDRFNNGPDSFRGRGIGDIMVTFEKLDEKQVVNPPR